MSFDLVETERNLSSLRGTTRPEPGAWDNFLSGTGMIAMRGLAETGRAASLAVGGVLSIADRVSDRTGKRDLFTGEAQEPRADRWFKLHDDIFNRAVEHWTPKPGEVGVAAEIAGTLLSTLPLVIASPAAAVAKTQLTTAEDLVRKGVDPAKAEAVAAVQAAGLGLGIWMPILGQTGFQRLVLGGAGFNVAQGVVTRGVSGSILAGTAAEKDFEAFDWSAITLDTLLGLAFGGIAHLSPGQRKVGENAWRRISDWVQGARPSDIDALVALRQAQHLNVDSQPGKAKDLESIDAHVTRMRTALEQLANDEPIRVDDLPEPRMEHDQARADESAANVEALKVEAERVLKERGLMPPEQAVSIEPRAEVQANLLPETAGVDPIQAEATRFVTENPDLQITVGRNPDGTPIGKTAKEFLAESEAQVAQAQGDTKLFEIAAACLLGAA